MEGLGLFFPSRPIKTLGHRCLAWYLLHQYIIALSRTSMVKPILLQETANLVGDLFNALITSWRSSKWLPGFSARQATALSSMISIWSSSAAQNSPATMMLEIRGKLLGTVATCKWILEVTEIWVRQTAQLFIRYYMALFLLEGRQCSWYNNSNLLIVKHFARIIMSIKILMAS